MGLTPFALTLPQFDAAPGHLISRQKQEVEKWL